MSTAMAGEDLQQPEEGSGFHKLVTGMLRAVGLGNPRTEEGNTMPPSVIADQLFGGVEEGDIFATEPLHNEERDEDGA